MTDLVAFLRAQLDEDERVARAVDPDHWQIATHPRNVPESRLAERAHIQRYAPAHMLAEVEAKRRLIEQIGQYEAWLDAERGYGCSAEEILAGRCSTIKVDEILALRLLAMPYADQPGYMEEWRP